MKKSVEFLKEPLADGRLKLIPSILIFIASAFVNAYFLNTSFAGLIRWFLNTGGSVLSAEAQQSLSEMLNQSRTALGSKLAFGLLMTVFAMVFLLVAAYLEESVQERNIKSLFERACSTMLVPVLLMLTSALLMNLSFAVGIVFAIFAVADCAAVIVKAGRNAKLNGYIIIATTAAFILITLVLCTRNHFITMFG